MTRKKVKLAYITNDSARKATFKKRKKGLIKKVTELSTLCGIQACAIIYSPYDSQPEVWPNPLGVQRVIAQFKTMPEMEQSKKMVNQETFLRQRIHKVTDQLKKQRKENREKEVTQVMFQSLTGKTLANLNMMDLNDLGWLIDQYLKEINKRMETIRKAQVNNLQLTAPVAGGEGFGGAAGASGFGGEVAAPQMAVERQNFEMNSMQPWFMDMINPQEQLGFAATDDMILPFGDHNHNSIWFP